MNFAPGDDYLYSNTGYFLLSLVIKKASGKSLREFAQEHIFATLGLKDTQILDDHTKVITRKAASYAPTRDGGFRNVTSNWEQTGDGAVQTTVGDFAKWDANFYTGKVGGSALVRELETTDVLNDGTPINYALGLTVDQYRGLRRVAHRGSWDGLRSYYSRTTMTVRRFYGKRGTTACRTRARAGRGAGGWNLYRAASGVQLRFENGGLVVVPPTGKSDRFERVTEAAAPAFTKFAGDYWSAELGLAVRILRFTDARLRPVAENVVEGPGVVVAFDKEGFFLGAGMARGMRFVRVIDLQTTAIDKARRPSLTYSRYSRRSRLPGPAFAKPHSSAGT